MTSHELANKLLQGPDLLIQIPLRNMNPNLEEVEEVEYAIVSTDIYLLGKSERQWVSNMFEEWGNEKVLF
ncbi:MAG: hypothetical protein EOO43_00665 [Flavobacterium sp.]|nr:MAG: hypothetical protein EOO43_00665 [Flavobacterium sp.]